MAKRILYVSVPLRGIGLERAVGFLWRKLSILRVFPSPCGELVWKVDSEALVPVHPKGAFPSPCGELVWKGEGCFCHIPEHRTDVSSFRPLAGNWFGKTEAAYICHCNRLQKFPSPCGELVWKVYQWKHSSDET